MQCERCGEEVKTDPGQVVLSCDPVYTPFHKRGQFTTLVKHTHGVGKRMRWVEER